MSDSAKDDLLLLKYKGSAWHQEFVNDCKDASDRFERAIKCRKVKNKVHYKRQAGLQGKMHQRHI